jgi:Xaa-Pro aminopeptidase
LIGDTTILQPGMTFAVDGRIFINGELAERIGGSIVVTETGCDYLTDYRREIMVTAS